MFLVGTVPAGIATSYGKALEIARAYGRKFKKKKIIYITQVEVNVLLQKKRIVGELEVYPDGSYLELKVPGGVEWEPILPFPDDLTKLAYDILGGDPIARDVAEDVLAGLR